MEKLSLNIFIALNHKFSTYIAGPKGSSEFHRLPSFVEFPFKPLWLYVLASLLKVSLFAIRIRPNVVFCGSGTSILTGYISAKLCSAKLICYLHGLDIVASSILYQSLFIPLIKRSDFVIVNSKHTCGLAISAGIAANKIHLLPPGVGFPDASKKKELAHLFRHSYGLGDGEFLLIAGRITARKGIAEFIDQLFVCMVAQRPELKLVIVGDEALDAAKSSKGVTDVIYKTISKHRIEANVILTGGVNEETFSSALFAASTFVFPVLDLPNDVEGFGMVAIEAAAHGLPTIGFAVGGIPDAVEHGKSGWLVKSGDYQGMGEKIFSYLEGGSSSAVTPESCKLFAKKFEWSEFERRLQKIIEKCD